MSEDRHQRIREMYNIMAEGEDIPSPLCRFEVCPKDISSNYLFIIFFPGYETTASRARRIEKKENPAPDADTDAGYSDCVGKSCLIIRFSPRSSFVLVYPVEI